MPQARSKTKPKRAKADSGDDKDPALWLVFCILLCARLLSAAFNIVHDCDEVFNYWEPLHYLIYGSGMQTWEYSSQYALRSYVYLLLHAVVAYPASLLFGDAAGKVAVFYLTKAGLGLATAASETLLYRQARETVGGPEAAAMVLLLATSSGMFAASTALLPSSFAMLTLTLSAAALLAGRPLLVIPPAALGIVWGWPVAGVAFLPYAVYVLLTANLVASVATGVASLALTLGAVVGLDAFFYGRWTVSLWNFIRYNVVGGGDSALYGVEAPDFYLRNGALNLNLALPLGLLAPLLLPLRPWKKGWARLLTALAPIWLWGAAISYLPHKEERFLYVIYPLVCLAAGVTVARLPDLARAVLGRLLPARPVQLIGQLAVGGALSLCVLLSLSRTAALLTNYSAPMSIYRHLPSPVGAGGGPALVCVGDEWHRFPSAFMLPSPSYRLAFLRSGFHGLLPRQFDSALGGTTVASPYLNDRNREEAANYLEDTSSCSFFVGLQERGQPSPPGEGRWRLRASLPFVDVARSPSQLARALYVPWLSAARNHFMDYVLYERVAPTEA